MRRSSSLPLPATERSPRRARSDWHTVRTLLPYLLAYKGRVLLALGCLVAAKLANVGVPLVLKQIVDRLTAVTGARRWCCRSRCSSLTARCACRRRRSPSCANICSPRSRSARCARSRLKTFRHLHALSLRFHLARQTGGLTRDVERGNARHLDADRLHAVFDPADADRDRAGLGDPRYPLRRLVHRHHARRARHIHRLHGDDHRMAHRLPPADERARFQGEYARDRQPAQLRDGQVLQQRGIRGAPLRREPAALGGGGRQEPDLAVAAQHRAERDHRDRGDADHVARDAGRGRAHDDHRRPGAGQRVHDPALHPAQLSRRHLPRDQAGAGRHGAHVPADRGQRRGQRRAGRAAARRPAAARSASSTSISATSRTGRSCSTCRS